MKIEKSNKPVYFTENLKLPAVCVITAAGLSTRMNKWKAELETRNGITMIQQAVQTARSSCSRVIVVGGYNFDKLKNLIEPFEDLQIIENKNYKRGMLSSIQTGLSLVDQDFFILPLDMPLITDQHFKRIFTAESEKTVVRPEYNGNPGHPVYFHASWKQKILKKSGSSLGTSLSREDQFFLSWEDDSVIFDMDTQDVYQEYLKR